MSVHRTLPSPKAARPLPRLLPLLAAVTLAACGGGGGGEAPPVDAPTPAPAPAPAPVPPGTAALLAGSTTENGCVDGPAATARFGSPRGIAQRDINTLLVADEACHAIRNVNITTGAVSTFVGKLGDPGDVQGAVSEAKFIAPFDLQIINQGALSRLLITDRGSHRVLFAFISTGNTERVAGTGIAGDTDAGATGDVLFGQPVRSSVDAQLNEPTFIATGLKDKTFVFNDSRNRNLTSLSNETTGTHLLEPVTPLRLCGAIARFDALENNAPSLLCAATASVGDTAGVRIVLLRGNAETKLASTNLSASVGLDGVGELASFAGINHLLRISPTKILVADTNAIRQVEVKSTSKDFDTVVSTVLPAADASGGEVRNMVLAPDGKTVFYTTPRGVVRGRLP